MDNVVLSRGKTLWQKKIVKGENFVDKDVLSMGNILWKNTFCQGGTLFKTEVLSRGKFLWKIRNFVQGKLLWQ